MPDGAEHLALGGGNVGVTRPHDLHHWRDAFGAIGKRGDRLGTTDAVHLIDPGEVGGSQHQRVEVTVGRGHHHDQALAADHLGRHGVHQHGRGIGGGAAGHVEADGLDRGPAPAQLDAEWIGEAQIFRHLFHVKRTDALVGEAQRVEILGTTSLHGGGDLVGRDPQAETAEVDTVESLRKPDQRGVAIGAHLLDDGAHDGVDVLRHLALGGEQRGKGGFEIRAPAVEAQGHACSPERPRGGWKDGRRDPVP